MRQAIIFDFDGTIADTMHAAREVLNEMSEDYGFARISEDEVEGLRGHTVDSLVSHLGIKRRHVPMILAKGVKALRSRIRDTSPCKGMAEAIRAMRPHAKHFGILTSNSAENVRLFLEVHGLAEHFTFVSSVSKLKGKARYLKSIARTFSLLSSEMLYIGDEVRDVLASNKAAVPVVAVTWGFNSAEALKKAGPTYLALEPSDLIEIARLPRFA